MHRSIRIYLYIFLALISFSTIAQDTIPETYNDLKYREDQFYIGAIYNIISQVPSGVNIRGLSGGIQFGYLRDMPINKRRSLAIAIGAGLSFNEYGQTLFIGEKTTGETIFTVLDDKNVDYTSNRFNTSSIEVPVQFRWRSSTPTSYKFWRIYVGFKVGYVYWYKSTFKQPGNIVKQTDIPEFENLRFGTTFSFGYNTWNFFTYYSLNPFFKNAVTTDGKEINFKTIQVGLIFYLL
jgi:hypothetical protein